MNRRGAKGNIWSLHESAGRGKQFLISWTVIRAAAALFLPVSNGDAGTGTIQDVQHVVILAQENRSFDHYLGALNGVRGFSDPNVLLLPNGTNDLYQSPTGGGYVLPFPIAEQCNGDVNHDWPNTHYAWDSGKWDRWVAFKGPNTMEYYTRTNLPFYSALADAYTLCDAYHCSVLGPTMPNRLYLWTATIDPNGIGGGPVTNNVVPAGGFTWTTYPERLQNAGVSWRVYQQSAGSFGGNPLAAFAQYKNALPGNPLYDRGMVLVTNLVAAFQFDVTNGTLPRVSWVIPPWTASEHPPYSPATGQFLTEQLLDALAANPAVYNSTVFMLTYDENGGFFDHVPPPVPPPGTTNEFIHAWPIGLGARVPMILVSPWTRGGYVCSQVFDHTSVLRFLEAWTGVPEPNVSAWRRQVCGDLTSAFDFAHPDTTIPTLPAIAPVTCPSGTNPPVPSPQVLPVQDAGSRPARPLPYQPDATGHGDCRSGRLAVVMTNAGAASVHFAIYANAYTTNGPWQYDVSSGSSLTDSFAVIPLTGGPYDFTCYGPNGFQRRFVGNLATDCNEVEVRSAIDANAGVITLVMTNPTSLPMMFTVTNGYGTNGLSLYNVPANGTATNTFAAMAASGGWYDLTVTASNNAAFLRRLAGHIEASASLAAILSGGSLILTYPAWASGSVLQCSPQLAPAVWTAVSAVPTNVGNATMVTVPVAGTSMYFRLSP